MQGSAVLAAFVPLFGFGFVACSASRDGLLVCVGSCGLAGLLAKLRRDRHLGIDLALHLVLIKDPFDPRGIARAHALVASDAGDACRGGALRTAAVLAHAGSHPVDDMFAALLAGVDVDADRLAFVVRTVVQVAGGERASCAEAVLAPLHRRLGAGDDGALQVGVALDADLEAAVSGLDAALLGDALVVTVDLALAGVQSAASGYACRAERGASTALLPAFKAAAVLQAFDMEVAAHFGDDLLAADHRSLQVGVAAGLQGGAVDVASGLQGCAVVVDHMAASDRNVPASADGDGVAAHAAALRLGRAQGKGRKRHNGRWANPSAHEGRARNCNRTKGSFSMVTAAALPKTVTLILRHRPAWAGRARCPDWTGLASMLRAQRLELNPSIYE